MAPKVGKKKLIGLKEENTTQGKSVEARKKDLLSGLNRKYGSRVTMGGVNKKAVIDVLPTGSLSLDIALGVGGIPRGRIVEIAGMESTGKTTLALKIIRNAQQMGYRCAFIDTEYALDVNWATSLGVNMEELDVYEADVLEVAGEMLVRIAESGLYDVIVFDSIGAVGVNAEHEGELGDANMGVRARILGQLMHKVTGLVTNNKQWLVLINQLRHTMDQYNPFIAPGGKAVPFAATQRIFLTSKKQKVDQGKDVEYNIVRAKVEKNKVAPPYRTGEYHLMFETGDIDTYAEVAAILTDSRFTDKLKIQRTGAWYTLPENLYPPEYEPEKINGEAKMLQVMLADIEHLEQTVIPHIRKSLISYEDQGARNHTGEIGPDSLSKDLENEDENYEE